MQLQSYDHVLLIDGGLISLFRLLVRLKQNTIVYVNWNTHCWTLNISTVTSKNKGRLIFIPCFSYLILISFNCSTIKE